MACSSLQDVEELIKMYSKSIEHLDTKIDGGRELIEALEEDVEEWETERAVVATQLTKYIVERDSCNDKKAHE